jgi:hypothetical protein
MREACEKISDGGEKRVPRFARNDKVVGSAGCGTVENRALTTSKGFLQRLKPVL